MATASPEVLAPADGSMVPVMVTLDIQDESFWNPAVTLVAVEADEELEEGDVQEANFGIDDRTLFLKAKKTGSVRTYRILYEITDEAGNISFADAKVSVP